MSHIVNLSHKDKNNRMQYCHMEYEYKSNQYINRYKLSSIKLQFDSFLLLEDMDKDWSMNRGFKINQMNFHRFKHFLKKIIDWFENDKYDDLYYYEDSILKLNLEFSLKETLITNMENILLAKPTVILVDDIYYEGIVLYINNNDSGGYITIDNLIALYDSLENFNLYIAGLMMLSYVQRPAFNTFTKSLISNNSLFTKQNNDHNYSEESYTKTNMNVQKKNELDEFFS